MTAEEIFRDWLLNNKIPDDILETFHQMRVYSKEELPRLNPSQIEQVAAQLPTKILQSKIKRLIKEIADQNNFAHQNIPGDEEPDELPQNVLYTTELNASSELLREQYYEEYSYVENILNYYCAEGSALSKKLDQSRVRHQERARRILGILNSRGEKASLKDKNPRSEKTLSHSKKGDSKFVRFQLLAKDELDNGFSMKKYRKEGNMLQFERVLIIRSILFFRNDPFSRKRLLFQPFSYSFTIRR